MALVPYSYCNPYNEQSNSKSFIIGNHFIKINQTKEKGIGFTFWDCSFVLSQYIEKNLKDELLNKTCLELGTGCGLVSICLSLISCQKVYATDLENILDIVKENIYINFEKGKENLIVKNLEWGNEQDINWFKNQNINIDYIFISDCLYKEAPWEKLLETILYFSKINPNMKIVFAYKKRYIYQEYFLNEAEKYYEFFHISQDEIYHEFQKNSFFILIFFYKGKKQEKNIENKLYDDLNSIKNDNEFK